MKFICLGVFISLFVFPVLGQTKQTYQNLWSRNEVRHAAIGICVKDVNTGLSVYEYNSAMALRPASVIKLLSSILALKRNGDSLTYQTPVFYTGKVENGELYGNIVIGATGDPTLDSRYFPKMHFVDSIVTQIVNLKIKQIHGNVIFETKDEFAQIPGSWPWEDVANYYGALCHAFNYRDNTYVINLRSGKIGTSTKIISVIPTIPGVKLQNEVIASTTNRNDAWIYGGPQANVLLIQGSIPANRVSFAIKGAMHHPEACFREELEMKLQKQGISLGKQKIENKGKHVLQIFTSPLLKDIVYCTNKNSVNLFAEALGKLVSPTDYAKTVKKELNTMGIDSSGIMLKDACGLSPANAVPAEVFTDLLIWANKNLNDTFLVSLPQGDVDNGLRIYADHPFLRKCVRAKTGAMSGVRALSGYLKTQKGRILAFTIIVNNYVCDSEKIQQIMRDFLKMLAIE